MIRILDYGSGNVEAIQNIYRKLGIHCSLARVADDLFDATRLILPGVGAFDSAMEMLSDSGMIPALNHLVRERNMPVLGVCVGMQIMAGRSEEGKLPGLGWFDAEVIQLDTSSLQNKPHLPHMGWNSVSVQRPHAILKGIDLINGFYFLHSFHFKCNAIEDILTTTMYGQKFASSVSKGNIFGFQFHPEKSHQNGIQVFANFAKL